MFARCTSSGAVAVQIVTRAVSGSSRSSASGTRTPNAELAPLLATALKSLHPGQNTLDRGDVATVAPRVKDVPDWTAGRRLGQTTLDESLDQAGPFRAIEDFGIVEIGR